MLSRAKTFIINLFSSGPTQHIEQNNEEHHTISRKRLGDFLNIAPSKRICSETRRPTAGPVGKEVHPLQDIPIDSHSHYFLKPDERNLYPEMQRRSNRSTITNPMDSKIRGASFSTSRSTNHGKENNEIVDISDEDDDICQAAHTHPSMKTNSNGACWINAEPKHNPTSKTFQRPSCKEKSKTLKSRMSSVSKSTDFTTVRSRSHWPEGRPSSILKPFDRLTRAKPVSLHRTRMDNRTYHPLTESAIRGIEETFRLEDRNSYFQLLQHYLPGTQRVDGKPLSTGFQNTGTKFDGLFDQSAMFVTLTKNKGTVEYIDLVPKNKEQEPTVRRDQEQKPLTLASKQLDGSKEIATSSWAKAQTLQKNSLENIIQLSSCTKPVFLEMTLKKYEEKNRNTRESLQESQLRAEQLARHKDESHLVRVLRHIKITDSEPVLDDVIEDEVPELPLLTPRMQNAIDSALVPGNPREPLVESFSLKITKHDIQTLAKLNWLNDEVINFYMNLLIERGKRDNFPTVHAFNTFFYTKLTSSGFATLKRWTKKIDIFSYDLIIVPVHRGMHWCMAAIDFRDKTIKYYDSMGSPNNTCLNALMQYLEEESLDKKKIPYDTSSWKKINVKDNPQQMNGSDCGVFACIYAEYICRNAKITFTQANMPYFRRKMVFEILQSKLLDFN